MAFGHGSNAGILVAQYDVSGFLNQFQKTRTADTAETTTFGNDNKTFIPGLLDGSISMSGFWDGTDDSIDEQLQAMLGAAAPKPITLMPSGLAVVGNRGSIAKADKVSYDVGAAVGDAVTISSEFKPTDGLWPAVLLAELAARTSASNTAAVDNGASSANGAVGNLHLTDFDGTNITIKIQDSPDNSTWADFITFSVASGVTSEQASAAGTVDQYLRVIWTGTFTSATFAVACARK